MHRQFPIRNIHSSKTFYSKTAIAKIASLGGAAANPENTMSIPYFGCLSSNSTSSSTSSSTAARNNPLNISSIFNNKVHLDIPVPPFPASNYQSRITRHQMESKYLTNLINFKPRFFKNQSKFSMWHKVPIHRRSAVMVLLFLGNEGELRVVLTKRSRQLKNFSGHVSLPGGKADSGLESEFQCARRETEEEIGISRHNTLLQKNFGFVVDELKTLPSYLARTFLAVSPCVGYINWGEDVQATERRISSLVLNPGESASVFSVPLRDFLQPKPDNIDLKECLKQSYIQTKWAGLPWNLRSFVFPVLNPNEVDWLNEIDDLSSASEHEDETHEDQELDVRTRNCWGLTANILHDIAEIVYHGGHSLKTIGEEDLIHSLHNHGQINTKERTAFEKRLINNKKGSLFSEVIPADEMEHLKSLYKN